jgi:cytochrome c-type biogenesis protein CcmH/NrfG
LFVFVGKLYAADIYAGSALRQAQVTQDGSIAKVLKAANLNTKESRYYTNIGQQYMVLANNEMLKSDASRDVTAVQNYLNNAVVASTQGRDLAPTDAATVEALAQIYVNAGVYVPDSFKLAEDTYKRALELEPNNPDFTLALGKIKLNQVAVAKNDDEKKQLVAQAKDLFQKSIDQKNNFAPGYYQLAIVQADLGNLDTAIETMRKATSLDNSNVNYFFSLARLYQQRDKGDDNKIAESLFKQILGVNDKEINTHFSLAMLYEKMNEKDKSVVEYNRVLELLPADNKEVIDKVKTMIGNVKNGISNLQAKPTDAASGSAQPTVSTLDVQPATN